MNNLQTFHFEEQEVRTQVIDGEPWFVGKDVADVLGYKNGSRDINRHVEEEDKLKYRIGTAGQAREQILVNESGLYNLIFNSTLDNAKKFKRWVTSEVLPTIRKHGGYLTEEKLQEALLNPDTIITLALNLKEERDKRAYLEQQIAEYEPKIGYLDQILSSTNTVTITQIAADYGMSGRQMNQILHELGVQHKISGQWILYRKHMKQGYTKSHTSEIAKADGGTKVVMNTKWTQKGRLFLYNLLLDEGYLPQMDAEPE